MKPRDEFPKPGDNITKDREAEKELIAKLKAKMRLFLDKKGIDEYNKWRDQCIEIIQQGHPDPLERHKHRLYHALMGGSYGDSPEFDFPGECSIQKMIEELRIE